MTSGNSFKFYADVCAKQQIRPNPHILDVLEKTQLTEDVTLKLAGNDRLRRVQRLDDRDVLVLSTCLRGDTRLDVSYNNITDEGAGHLAELLQDGSVLRSLDLTFNDIQTGGARALAKSLQGNGTVRALRLSGNKIGDGGAMHLASMLQVNPTLRELEVASCDLGSRSVTAFAVVLKSNQNVRCVDMSRPLLRSHQEEWAVHVSDMLVLNSCLLELHLGAMGMSNAGMEVLSEGLRLNRGLRYLDLRCNRVSSDGVRHLAEVMRHNTTLEILDLSSNRIGDEGAGYLSAALARLSVRSNNIRTEGLLSLARALKVNDSLKHLYVWGNHLDEPVCQAFRELMASGRLPPQQTDVSAYQVDGHVFLAEVFDSLRNPFPTYIICFQCLHDAS
uniref:Uncharacterized protein n=1 Tax=Mola mola TaxID=94237 RepID=A0A3Q3WZF4_MOLML